MAPWTWWDQICAAIHTNNGFFICFYFGTLVNRLVPLQVLYIWYTKTDFTHTCIHLKICPYQGYNDTAYSRMECEPLR